MENPCYWSQAPRPRYSSNIRGIPLQSIHQKPEVAQMPVHFVSSEPHRPTLKPDVSADRSGSALRIQKVFRGFLVRKSVKRIMSLRKEVDAIERKLFCRETTELIRRDERERLRVNETLMSLIFKLDSICGVDSGVRECRKAVIKKAISLQEKVDSIVSAGNQMAAEEENQCSDCDELSEPFNQEQDGKSTNQSEPCDQLELSVDVENQATSRSRGHDNEEESGRNREILEEMVEKNEKMMRMMNELCQKNEVQMWMLNSLVQRVDQLEKAFLCDRLKMKKTNKKKKQRHPAEFLLYNI